MARTNNYRELPVGVVQHIQSFLVDKKAAQTSLVAKSWYHAWCIRPNIYFIADVFDSIGRFWEYATRTVQRCIYLKVKVDKLALLMPFNYMDAALIDKLVVDSLELRVNVFEVNFYDNEDLYVLPVQMFTNKYLTVLYLGRCKVDNLVSTNVSCPKLTTLELNDVSIEDKAFKDIIVGSPIIESLTMTGKLTTGLKTIDARNLCNLKTLVVKDTFLDSPGVTSSVICGRFLNLNSMVLKDVRVDNSFFANLSSSFPKLEDLSLKRLIYDLDILRSSLIISSSSIKRLSLKLFQFLGILNMVKFNVPNVKKFKFSGDHVPPMSFATTYEEWESEIKLSRFDELMIWPELRDLRRKLVHSKISLEFTVCHDRVVNPRRSFEDYCLPAVEELFYYNLSTQGCNFFIECVSSFKPKLVYFYYKCDEFVTLPILVLHDLLKMQEKDNPHSIIHGLSFFYMNDLLKVSVECLGDSLNQWQPLADVVEIQNYEAEQLRLKLEWESQQTIINFIDYR